MRDCKKFLTENSWLRSVHGAGPIDNARWWPSSQKAETLRKRLSFHILKFQFMTEPFKIQLHLDTHSELAKLRKDVAILTAILNTHFGNGEREVASKSLQDHRIPEPLVERFVEAANDPGLAVADPSSGWPLKELFDALATSIAKSTVEFTAVSLYDPQEPNPAQCLNLHKSVWIWEQIQDSSLFKQYPPNSLLAEYMKELERNIYRQLLRFKNRELVEPSLELLYNLPNTCFTIWRDEGPPASTSLARPQAFEAKILELPIVDEDSSSQRMLTVFRRDEVKYRLAIGESSLPSIIDMESNRLIPYYAHPVNKTMKSLGILDKDGENPILLDLQRKEDLLSLQHALTGYRVQQHATQIEWWINGSEKPKHSGTGKLQLWQADALPEITTGLESSTKSQPTLNPKRSTDPSSSLTQSVDSNLQDKFSKSPASPQSIQSNGTDRGGPSPGHQSTTSRSQRSFSSRVSGQKSQAFELLNPQNPVLVIFTEHEKRLKFFRLMCKFAESTPLILQTWMTQFAVTKEIRMASDAGDPGKVVLENENKRRSINLENFSVSSSTETDANGLPSWNLAVFRYPEHPDINKVKPVKGTKYLVLQFPTVEGESFNY